MNQNNSQMDHNHHDHSMHNDNEETKLSDYIPLFIVFGYILIITTLFISVTKENSLEMVMSYFMGGFFLIFSLFKLLDLKGFAQGYSTYDIIAKKLPGYGFIYPFIELILGVFYLLNINSLSLNLFTAILMSLSSVGVINSLLKKQKIHCACLGNILKVPLSKVTLVEDLLMVVMALFMIIN